MQTQNQLKIKISQIDYPNHSKWIILFVTTRSLKLDQTWPCLDNLLFWNILFVPKYLFKNIVQKIEIVLVLWIILFLATFIFYWITFFLEPFYLFWNYFLFQVGAIVPIRTSLSNCSKYKTIYTYSSVVLFWGSHHENLIWMISLWT